MPFTANYHTHTYRCDHAEGDAIDYARIAERAGMTILGFSDHTPLPDGRWDDMRMGVSQLDEYESAVAEAAQAVPSLTILLGLECEYFPEYHAWYEDEILGKRGYDYLIAGCHYTPYAGNFISSFGQLRDRKRLLAYSALTIATMESGLFAFITHPDIIGCSYGDWNEDLAACAHELCAAAKALAVPLEINSYGYRKPWVASSGGQRPAYPWLPFWEIAAEHQVEVVLSSDAHYPQDVAANYDEVAAIRDKFGLFEADMSKKIPLLKARD
jgi:histidinol-phosphatase (PHP family)